MATYDGSNLKQTEYDFPKPLLDKADVTTTKAADQPVYNSDLAKVTNQAINAEQDAREQADAAEQEAREQADSKLEASKVEGIANGTTRAINLGSDFAASGTDIAIADKAITTAKLADDVNETIGTAVTAPSTTTTTPNMLDTDIFETQEVDGQTRVTLKAGVITNKYLKNGSVSYNKLAGQANAVNPIIIGALNKFSRRLNSKGVVICGQNSQGMAADLYGYNDNIVSANAIVAEIPKSFFSCTNNVSTFSYNTPTTGITSLVERYNLVSFGVLSLILVQAVVTYSDAADAYVTLTKDKVWTTGYKGVTNAQPTDFAPFLLAEAPTNPSAVTTSLVHDDTNGYRLQLHADTAGEYTCEYVLGNIDSNLFIKRFEW